MASPVPFNLLDVEAAALQSVGNNVAAAAQLQTNPVRDPALTADLMNDATLRPVFMILAGEGERIVRPYLTKVAGPERHDLALPMIRALAQNVVVAPSRLPVPGGLGWGVFARRDLDNRRVLGFYGGAVVGSTEREAHHMNDLVDAGNLLTQRIRPEDKRPLCFDYQWSVRMTGRPLGLSTMNPAIQRLFSGSTDHYMYILSGHAPNQLAFINTRPVDAPSGVRNNVVAVTVVWRGVPRSLYYTTRPVRAGEELFVDYGSKMNAHFPAIPQQTLRAVEKRVADLRAEKRSAYIFDWPVETINAGLAQNAASARLLDTMVSSLLPLAAPPPGENDAPEGVARLAPASEPHSSDDEDDTEARGSVVAEVSRRRVRAKRNIPALKERIAHEVEEADALEHLSSNIESAQEASAIQAIVVDNNDAPTAAIVPSQPGFIELKMGTHTSRLSVTSDTTLAEAASMAWNECARYANDQHTSYVDTMTARLQSLQQDADALRKLHAQRTEIHGYRQARDANGTVVDTEVLLSHGDGEKTWQSAADLYKRYDDIALVPDDEEPLHVRRIVDFERVTGVLSRQIPPDVRLLVEWDNGERHWIALASFLDASRDYAYGAVLREYLDYLEARENLPEAEGEVPNFTDVSEAIARRVAYLRHSGRGQL